jgi:flagellar protein FlaG
MVETSPLSAVSSQSFSVPKNDSPVEVTSKPVELKPKQSFQTNEEVTISSEDLQLAVERLNESLSKMNRDINFSVDSATGKDVVRVMDKNGGLVRQLPNLEMLNFIQNLDKMMGLIFDKRT